MTTNRKLMPTVFLSVAGLTMAQAQWIYIADFDTYQIGWGVPELKEVGWTFQDGAYADYPQCTNGTWDCDAMRVITSSPFNPTFGSDKSLMLRGGNPASDGVANSRNNTAITLPKEIPLNGKATIYIHFALENQMGNRFFVLSDLLYANAHNNAAEVLNNGASGVMINLTEDFRLNVFHEGGYVPSIIDGNDADANLLEDSTWYDLYIQVDNQSFTNGDGFGSRYDLYIRGGKFGDTPVHLTNTDKGYKDAGYTAWSFRRNIDEPVRSFNILAQYGVGSDTVHGFGAIWVNALYMFVGEYGWAVPIPGGSGSARYLDTYDVDANGWADTGDWMGWLHVSNAPWIYSYSLGHYVYINADGYGTTGGWIYALQP